MASAGSRSPGWAGLRSVLAACGFLVALLWQFTAPVLANTPCGLIAPHEHLLTGQANEYDLERHMAAEANCALGKPDAPEEQAAELAGSKGRILNVIRFDRSQPAPLSMLLSAVGDIPTAVVIQHPQPLYSLLIRVHLLDRSVTTKPPKPPPKSA